MTTTVGTVAVLVVGEALVASAALFAVRRARRQAKDRRRSDTIGDAGVGTIFVGLALAIPAAALRSAGSGPIVNQVAVLLLIVGFLAYASSKPIGYLEERGAAKMQRAAGIPSPAPLVPPWAVALLDVAGTVMLIIVVFLGLSLLASHDRWTLNHLESVTTPTGLVVLAAGAVVATWHYWWQGRRVKRSKLAHQADNGRFLG